MTERNRAAKKSEIFSVSKAKTPQSPPSGYVHAVKLNLNCTQLDVVENLQKHKTEYLKQIISLLKIFFLKKKNTVGLSSNMQDKT